MKLFGLEIKRRTKALQEAGSSGWWPVVRDPYPGAWQQNKELTAGEQLAFFAVFSCITLISNDVGKLRPRLMAYQDGIKVPVDNSPYARVLKKPNHYQNHIQFKETWMISKLTRGNTVALKVRDNRGMITALYILDYSRVKILVSDSGEVFYELKKDAISKQQEEVVTVPASEVIHDRINCLFHPLIGISPLYACSLSAGMGLEIQQNSRKFFANGSRPGGVLSAPGAISDETAARLKQQWDANYTGDNAGKVAVVGDGLKYEPMVMTAHDAQMVEQLKMSAETVCSVFHVPSHMAIAGQEPNYNNIQALNLQYYAQCLQSHIEQFETVLDEGLGLPDRLTVELDLDSLLRMDTKTQAEVAAAEMGAGYLAPDEARRRRNLPPVPGGDTPYMQQQNYSLAALSRRDNAEPVADEPEPMDDDEALAAMAEGADDE
jgi:HK97 family phage portal protein